MAYKGTIQEFIVSIGCIMERLTSQETIVGLEAYENPVQDSEVTSQSYVYTSKS